MKQLVSALSLVALLATPAMAQTQDSSSTPNSVATPAKLNAQDRDFLKNASIGGLAEVDEAKVAADRAQHDPVKNFAQQMVSDHGKANAKLQALAGQIGVTPPAQPDKAHEASIQRLSKLSSVRFDKTYMQGEVPEHKKTIALFEKEIKSGQNLDLKQFASETLPTLQQHLKMAQDVNAQIAKQ